MTQALKVLHDTPLFKGLFAIAALVAIHVVEKPSAERAEAARDVQVVHVQQQMLARHADWGQVQMPNVQRFDRQQVRNAAEPASRDSAQVWNELPRQQRWVF
jgi:hypothetical protein